MFFVLALNKPKDSPLPEGEGQRERGKGRVWVWDERLPRLWGSFQF